MKIRIISFLFLVSLLIVPCFAFEYEEEEVEPSEDSVFQILQEGDLENALTAQAEVFGEQLQDALNGLEIEPQAFSSADTQATSFSADTSLGQLSFFLPAGTPSNPFIILSNGTVLNGTSSTIYLYCEKYPGYTFQASRFSAFQYRTNTVTSNPWYDLNLRNPSGLGSAPAGSGATEYLPSICLLFLAFCSALQLGNKKLTV